MFCFLCLVLLVIPFIISTKKWSHKEKKKEKNLRGANSRGSYEFTTLIVLSEELFSAAQSA